MSLDRDGQTGSTLPATRATRQRHLAVKSNTGHGKEERLPRNRHPAPRPVDAASPSDTAQPSSRDGGRRAPSSVRTWPYQEAGGPASRPRGDRPAPRTPRPRPTHEAILG